MALVENLRRLAQLIVRSRQARARADELADRLLGLSGWRVEQAEDVLRRVGDGPLVDAFAMQLFQRLRDQDASVLPVLDWLNEKLSAQGTSADEVVAREQHAQGAANVTVRNIITSMQWMSSVDWTDFFEAVSLVDEVLRAVPGFAEMDSETRSLCRIQIEMLSRASRHSELEVARKAVRLARDAGQRRTRRRLAPAPEGRMRPRPPLRRRVLELPGVPRRAEEYPAYYLLSQGRLAFEKRLGFRVPLRNRLRRFYRAHAAGEYLGAITGITAILVSGLLFLTWAAGASLSVLVVLGLLALAPASEIAVSLVNRLVSLSRLTEVERQARALPGGASGVSNHGRRAHVSHQRGGDRGAGRAARGALPGEFRGASPLCPPFRLERTPAMSRCPETISSLPP